MEGGAGKGGFGGRVVEWSYAGIDLDVIYRLRWSDVGGQGVNQR